MSGLITQSDYQTRIVFMIGILLLATLFFRLFERFERENKHYNWTERISLFALMEICPLFLLQTIFLAKETDWNGWFARKIYIPDTARSLFEIMLVGLPTYLLVIFSVVSLVGGFYILLYPSLFKKVKT